MPPIVPRPVAAAVTEFLTGARPSGQPALFVARRERALISGVSLDDSQAPALWALVRELAASARTRPPDRIRLIAEVIYRGQVMLTVVIAELPPSPWRALLRVYFWVYWSATALVLRARNGWPTRPQRW